MVFVLNLSLRSWEVDWFISSSAVHVIDLTPLSCVFDIRLIMIVQYIVFLCFVS